MQNAQQNECWALSKLKSFILPMTFFKNKKIMQRIGENICNSYLIKA